MKASKLIQTVCLGTLLLASAMIAAVEAHAHDSKSEQRSERATERHTYPKGSSVDHDTYRNDSSVDRDGPDQDPRYSEDDEKWDELDNSVNEERESDE